MIRDFIRYTILGGLLYGGHYFLNIVYPERALGENMMKSHILLFLLFVQSHFIGDLLHKKFDILIGQVFMGFSVFKMILLGLYIFFLKKTGLNPISNSFILTFMASYFIYLSMDVYLTLKSPALKD